MLKQHQTILTRITSVKRDCLELQRPGSGMENVVISLSQAETFLASRIAELMQPAAGRPKKSKIRRGSTFAVRKP